MPVLIPTMILPAITTDTLRAAIFMISANVLALWLDRFRAIKAGSPVQTNAPNSFWALSRDDILNGNSQSRFILQEAIFSDRGLVSFGQTRGLGVSSNWFGEKMWFLVKRRKRGYHVIVNYLLGCTTSHPTLASLDVLYS